MNQGMALFHGPRAVLNMTSRGVVMERDDLKRRIFTDCTIKFADPVVILVEAVKVALEEFTRITALGIRIRFRVQSVGSETNKSGTRPSRRSGRTAIG